MSGLLSVSRLKHLKYWMDFQDVHVPHRMNPADNISYSVKYTSTGAYIHGSRRWIQMTWSTSWLCLGRHHGDVVQAEMSQQLLNVELEASFLTFETAVWQKDSQQKAELTSCFWKQVVVYGRTWWPLSLFKNGPCCQLWMSSSTFDPFPVVNWIERSALTW